MHLQTWELFAGISARDPEISSWGPHTKALKIHSGIDQPLNLEKRCLPSVIFEVPGILHTQNTL